MSNSNTRRALLSSVVALVICITMLMGTTFAWFTDTASVNVNTIQSGTLKIDLVSTVSGKSVKNEANKLESIGFLAPADAEGKVSVYGTNILWEPGCSYILEPVKLVNKGNLWAKYEVVITGTCSTNEKNANLADVIEVYEDDKPIGTLAQLLNNNEGTFKSGEIAPGTEQAFGTITLKMMTTAGNEYQDLSISGITIAVYATQAAKEFDSTRSDYDAGAKTEKPLTPWEGDSEDAPTTTPEDGNVIVITTGQQLADFAAAVNAGNTYAGTTIKLGANIDLENREWTPIGNAKITNNKYDWVNSTYFAGSFDGQGYTISNLYVNNPDTNIQGLFGYGKLTEIKNVNINNATVNGLRRSAILVGQNDVPCNVSNVTITGDIKITVKRNEAGTLVGRGGLGKVTNVTVNASDGSFVKCEATSNANWEYVGGVWGHAWPSNATDVTSNIDVFAYASATGGIGGGCAANSVNVTCTGNVTMSIKDSEIHMGTIQCWQTNGLIYGFGVGSTNASTHTDCSSTGTLTIGGTVIEDLNLATVATGYTSGNFYGAPYYLSGVITIK